MANEISASLSINNSALYENRTYSWRADQTLKRRQCITQNVGTSEESLAINSDISSVGLVTILNKDTSNFVQVGFATGVYGMRLRASQGIPACFEADTTSVVLYLKADTAACDVDIEIWGK